MTNTWKALYHCHTHQPQHLSFVSTKRFKGLILRHNRRGRKMHCFIFLVQLLLAYDTPGAFEQIEELSFCLFTYRYFTKNPYQLSLSRAFIFHLLSFHTLHVRRKRDIFYPLISILKMGPRSELFGTSKHDFKFYTPQVSI